MRKLSITLALVGVLLLTACGHATKTVNAKHAHTLAVLRQKENVWAAVKTVTATSSASGQLSNLTTSEATASTPWISARNKLYRSGTYAPTASYASLKKQLNADVPVPKLHHLATIKQINATLKAMGANTTINSYQDLVYLKPSGGSTSTQIKEGFLSKGDHLYAVALDYTAGTTAGTVTRGFVYTNHYRYTTTKALTTSAVTGLWQASDGTQAMVRNGELVTIQNQAFVRGNVEDLSKQSQATLFANINFVLSQAQAAKQSVRLTSTSLAAGDLWGNRYVFLSPTKMVQVANGSVRIFTKTTGNTTSSNFPQAVFTVFSKLDRQASGVVAAYLLPKSGGTYSVGEASSNDYITANYSGGLTGAESATLNGNKLTVGADMNHN